MRHSFWLVVLSALPCSVLSTSPVLAGANTGQDKPNEETIILDRMENVVGTVCKKIFPAPKNDTVCLTKMRTDLAKKYPDASEKAREKGLIATPAGSDPASPESVMAEIRGMMLAECRSKPSFSACGNRMVKTLVDVFDIHTVYYDPDELNKVREARDSSIQGIGVELTGLFTKNDPLIVIEPLDNSPAKKAGILPEDRIIEVNDKPVGALKDLSGAEQAILGKEGTTVSLTIERKGKRLDRPFVITRGKFGSQSVKSDHFLSFGRYYALITLAQFDDGLCMRTKDAYEKIEGRIGKRKLSGLIISVEMNGGGFVNEAHCLLDLFTDAPNFVLKRDRDGIAPFFAGMSTITGDITNGLPILIVVNGGSASASEIFSRGMQHMGRAVIAGTNTFKKGLMQEVVSLGSDGVVVVTIAEYLLGVPDDWVPVQCIGVIPELPYDRGLDPKDDDGKRIDECSGPRKLDSGGPMADHPMHPEPEEETMTDARRMLASYKAYVETNKLTEKRRTINERYNERIKWLEKLQRQR